MKQFPAESLSAAMQLALDEALLLAIAEEGPCIRTWRFTEPTVVLGRSSKMDIEVDRKYCERHRVSVLRRCSGGGAIVGDTGCLMYTAVISTDQHPETKRIDGAHAFVMDRVTEAVSKQLPEVTRQGICDLTWRNKKFSGNALRVTRDAVLYHGTLLVEADLDFLDACLAKPPRPPEYRADRGHRDFVTNVPLDVPRAVRDLAVAFGAQPAKLAESVRNRAAELVRSRYSRDDWTFRH